MQQQPFEKPGRNSLALGIAIGVGVSILVGNLMLSAMHAAKLDALSGELEVVSQRMQSLAEENAALKGELERVRTEYSQVVVSAGHRVAAEEAKRKAAAEAARVRASSAGTHGGRKVAGNLDDLIISLVSQHWRRPPVTRNGVSATVLLQMRHDGTITGVGV
jgi:colicin import membrane protein